ncbi:MAG: peptidase domain-containing ABC transporter [Rhodothermaceae bacterium]
MKTQTPSLKESFQYFKRLMKLIKPYWGKLIKGMSLGLIVGLLGMISPYMTKLLIDKVYPTEDVSLMQIIVLGVLAVTIANSIIKLIQGYFNLYVNSKLSNSTSLMFFNHLQHLRTSFFDKHQVGEIMSRFKDVGSALQAVNKVFQTIFVNGIYIILVPPFLFILHWKLALVSLISLPVTMIIITISGKFIRKYWRKTSEAFADLNAFQIEMFTHIRTVKALVLENYVFTKAHDFMTNAIKMQLKAGGMGQIIGLSNGILYGLNTALFTYLGWSYILGKEMTLGDYIAFTAYIGYLYNPISQFVNLFSEFQQSSVNLNRMFEYLDSDAEQEYDNSGELNLQELNLEGNIALENLSFGYDKSKRVLNEVSLKIKPGTINAIVGPSGSGKTSLLRLLIGMEVPDAGDVLYDDKRIDFYNLSELRKKITVIWQEFSMFKGTIWENLTIGLENISRTAVDQAVEIAKMKEHIDNLPQGYETPIGEWGTTLSGGQRQRLAIARAIIRNSDIYIFDEATSNIDVQTEEEILTKMFMKLKNKTVLFVTHRISTASLADKIFLLEDGKLTAEGSHFELLEKNLNYQKMVSLSTQAPNLN